MESISSLTPEIKDNTNPPHEQSPAKKTLPLDSEESEIDKENKQHSNNTSHEEKEKQHNEKSDVESSNEKQKSTLISVKKMDFDSEEESDVDNGKPASPAKTSKQPNDSSDSELDEEALLLQEELTEKKHKSKTGNKKKDKSESNNDRPTLSAQTEELLQSLQRPDNDDEIRDSKKSLLARIRENSKNKVGHASKVGTSLYGPNTHRLPVGSAVKRKQLKTKKVSLLQKLRSTALKQGAEEMAKLFGYSSFQEQLQNLNKNTPAAERKPDATSNTPYVEGVSDTIEKKQQVLQSAEKELISTDAVSEKRETEDEPGSGLQSDSMADVWDIGLPEEKMDEATMADMSKASPLSCEEDIGGETSAGKATAILPGTRFKPTDADIGEEQDATEENDQEENSSSKRDKAAGYRAILEKEQKRAKKKKNTGFVDEEASEEEEENALNIGGLGDFGFGVPTNKVMAGDEVTDHDMMKLREDDLENIVDELSDEEKEKTAEEFFRKEQENLDKAEVSEVMRNVRDGFGRKRRAFAAHGEARGRFNLDELVAADGSKREAARLGLLESDEELSDTDQKAGDEIDEEAEMERMLRERVMNQPDIYITSSEDESDDDEPDKNDQQKDCESEEEIGEVNQAKHLSARAKINRRLKRVADAQNTNLAQLFSVHDDDTQDFFKCLKKTNVSRSSDANENNAIGDSLSSTSRFSLAASSGSSFGRVAETMKSFSASKTSTTAFVFTSKERDDNDSQAPDEENLSGNQLRNSHGKNKSSTVPEFPSAKKQRTRKSGATKPKSRRKSRSKLFTALAQYQCENMQE